jgi:hypothetical protein
MKYRRLWTRTGDPVPDLLLVERPEGVLYWHPTGEYLFARRTLDEIVPADVAHSEQEDEVRLSPVLEDPRPWESLMDEDLLALAASQVGDKVSMVRWTCFR